MLCEINMKYPLSKSLQSYLIALSENEILDLKADLSKHLQSLFIEKLSKSGLITERQLKGISQHINLVNFSSTPLKCIKPDSIYIDGVKYNNKIKIGLVDKINMEGIGCWLNPNVIGEIC